MQELRRKTEEFFVVQRYGKSVFSEEIEWRDIWKYNNIKHINEAKKALGKLQRGAAYEKTGEKFKIIKRTVETIVNVKDENLELHED